VSNVLYGTVEEQRYYGTGRVGENKAVLCSWFDPDLDPYYLSKINTVTEKSSKFYNPLAVLAKYSDSFPVSVEDPGCLSRIPIFSIPDPDPGSNRFPDPHPHQRI
jgi:hypothetical protein